MEHLPTTAVRHDLEEARDSLAYWERRERELTGRRQKGKRREAQEHVRRCRARVAELERAAYGAGARGALAQVVSEGRLPEPARNAGRRLARGGKRALVVTVATATAVTVLTLVLLVALVVAVL